MKQLLSSTIPNEVVQRFWTKVDQSQECWLWTGCIDPRAGYGQFWVAKRVRKAHRVSYALEHGLTPANLCVLHSCDNPPCVNPAHLWLGTQLENIADRTRKGRSNRRATTVGEAHYAAILTRADVLKIRHRKQKGEIYRVIAKDFPVSASAVGRICRREVWKHV